MIQAIQGRNGRFEDFYVEAKSEAEALRKARPLAKAAGFDLAWTRFVA
jgi:hypothetical protein